MAGDGAALSREIVVREALALLRAGSIDDVSLRKIATRLGVKAPSLYWHIGSKQALYALMQEAILHDTFAAMPPAADWRDWLRAFGMAFWRTQHDYPDGRQLSARAILDKGLRESVHRQILDQLAAAGLEPALAAVAQRSVLSLVIGWTTLKQTPGSAAGEDEAHFVDGLNVLIEGWEARVAGVDQ